MNYSFRPLCVYFCICVLGNMDISAPRFVHFQDNILHINNLKKTKTMSACYV